MDPPPTIPLAYFITFRTYGTWLPGDERTWVDDEHNRIDIAPRDRNDLIKAEATALLRHDPVTLNPAQRATVEKTIREVCEHRGWTLEAVNARTNHVHAVVRARCAPEPVMNAFKSWATRRLREAGLAGTDTHLWARHGSTRYLWDGQSVLNAKGYVETQQDCPERFL